MREQKLKGLFEFLSNAPDEVLEAQVKLAHKQGASFSELYTAAAFPRPADAPTLWAERNKGWNEGVGQKASPALWIKMHYGNKDPKNWDPMGLTRGHIWAIDRPLYQALGAWLSRIKQKSASYPEGMEAFLTSPTERLEAELAEVGTTNPQDAYRLFPNDPKKAERIRSALRRRVHVLD